MGTVARIAQELAQFAKNKAFALSLFSVMLAMIVLNVTERVNVVSIRDGEDRKTAYTMSNDPGEILENYGVVTLAYDAVDVSSLDGKLTDIEVSRAFPAYVEADGKRRKVMVLGGTVAELISRASVELGDLDEVNMPLDQEIEEDDVVIVTRKEAVTITEKEKLPYETIYTFSPDLAPGKEEVRVEGKDGLRVREIRQLLVNGEVIKETVKSDGMEREPVNAEILVGFPSKPVSPYNFKSEFDENGEPLEYEAVLREKKSAGYSAPNGRSTASGRKAVVGNVAVNPAVIPYGTKMFIKSSDGKHIYGYAVAADTGTALLNGLITVDLFYSSYAESANNGIRKVDIFILEWGEG